MAKTDLMFELLCDLLYSYIGTRQVGRPRQRWQEDVIGDQKKAESKKLEGDS